MNKIQKLVERGVGYYCFRKPKVEEHPSPVKMDEDAGMPEPLSDAVDVHRPVTVEVNDDGDPYAYYYDREASTEDLIENGGKVFVPLEQVHLKPLQGFDTPAHRVGE